MLKISAFPGGIPKPGRTRSMIWVTVVNRPEGKVI